MTPLDLPTRLVLAAVLAGALPAAAGELPDAERRLIEAVRSRDDAAVELLERAVNIRSATQNLVGVRETGEVFGAELKRLGFDVCWRAMPPAMRRAGHLVAERRGKAGKRLLLIGHLDTVLEGRPSRRGGRKVHGTGTVDMKAGNVVIIQALQALEAVGALDDRTITVVFTGDEEDAGMPLEESRSDLIGAAKNSDIALAFEEAVGDTATVARRGVSSWRLDVKAPTGHSSGILRGNDGAGAIYEAARILDAFRRDVHGDGLTINPSVISGGATVEHDPLAKRGTAEGKTNVIPARAVIEGDIRFISPEQKAAAVEKMKRLASENLARASAELTLIDEYPAMAPTRANYDLLALYSRASEDLGFGPVRALPPAERGAGDVSFVADLLPCLDGLGPQGDDAHDPDEWVDLDSMKQQAQRTALLIHRLTQE